MRDVIWTIIVIWVIWKIWSMIRDARTVVVQKNEQHNHYHQHNHNSTPEGTTHVSAGNSSTEKIFRKDEGDYVDFEEVKK
jgi:hypothetical protein